MKLNKKLHAERNKTLSEKLFNEGTYFDWVITTAFYSSVHYIEGKLLPCNVNGIECTCIYDTKGVYNVNSPHEARAMLVLNEFNNIYSEYKWLYDNSLNSRYKTYKISKVQAEKALNYIKKIEEKVLVLI